MKIQSENDFQKELIKGFIDNGWFCEKVISEGKNGRPDLNAKHHPFSVDIECKYVTVKDLKRSFKTLFQPGQLSTYVNWLSVGSGLIWVAIAIEYDKQVTFSAIPLYNQKTVIEIMDVSVEKVIRTNCETSVDNLVKFFIYCAS